MENNFTIISEFKTDNDLFERYFISSIFTNNYIDNKGNIQTREITKYNILIKEKQSSSYSVASPEWFNNYRANEKGELIVGIERNASEYLEYLKKYKNTEIMKYRYGFVNNKGKLSIQPLYDYLEFSTEDTCIATRFTSSMNKYGYIDNITGNQITPINFLTANGFKNGLARVQFEDKTAFVCRDRIITDIKEEKQFLFPPVTKPYNVSEFEDGLAIVSLPKQLGICNYYINTKGEYVPRAKAKEIEKRRKL